MYTISQNVEGFINDLVRKCTATGLYLYLREKDMGWAFDDKDAFLDNLSEYQRDHYDEMINRNNVFVENAIDSIGGAYDFKYAFAVDLVSYAFDDIEKLASENFDDEFAKLYEVRK